MLTMEKSVKKSKLKQDKTQQSYTLGILSIVFAFFIPLAGVVLGIVGLSLHKDNENVFVKRAKLLNIVGVILSVVLFGAMLLYAYYTNQGFPSV